MDSVGLNTDARRWLFTGGLVIDGTGAAGQAADVRVEDDRIVAVGPGLDAAGATLIDCRGRAVAPGFIDVHTHDDNLVLAHPDVTPKLSQGVTTCIVGNCGVSLAPLVTDRPPPPLNLLGPDAFRFATMAGYVAAVEATAPAVNVAALVGHSTLRAATMDDVYRAARPSEQAAMAHLTTEAMEAGAIGLSSGIAYAPGAAADVEEVAKLAGLAARYKGIYTAHIRSEDEAMPAALAEALDAAARAHVPLVVSHFKCSGPASWGMAAARLRQLDDARRRQDAGLDVYPYPASSTILRTDYLDRGVRAMVTFSLPHPEMTGRYLDDIAAQWGIDQKSAVERLQPGGAVYFVMSENDVRTVLRHPLSMIGSDGLPHDVHPHPRLWGTFPRVLGRYSRVEKLFPLETAIHKMTGLSAQRFRLPDRGVIRAGAFADLTVFDPATVIDRATFEQPKQPAAGIDLVMVNGRPAWHAGRVIGRSGRFLRHSRDE